MNFDLFGTSLRDLFQIKQINLRVAIWVGFLALFGITYDDGVIMTTPPTSNNAPEIGRLPPSTKYVLL